MAHHETNLRAAKPNMFRPTQFRRDDELVLFGYVHDFESHFADSFFIPKSIIEMIIAYYSWVDSWDIRYDQYFEVNTLNKSLRRRAAYNCSVHSAFGERTVATAEMRHFVWNVKIEAKGTDGRRWTDTIIGVIDDSCLKNGAADDLNKRGWSDFTTLNGCGLNTRNGMLLRHGTLKTGFNLQEVYAKDYHGKESDIICMLLTVNDTNKAGQHTLKYFINGVDQGYAAILRDGAYKLAISMAQPDQIKLF